MKIAIRFLVWSSRWFQFLLGAMIGTAETTEYRPLSPTLDAQVRLLEEMLDAGLKLEKEGNLTDEQERMLEFLTALVLRLRSGRLESVMSAIGSQFAHTIPGISLRLRGLPLKKIVEVPQLVESADEYPSTERIVELAIQRAVNNPAVEYVIE